MYKIKKKDMGQIFKIELAFHRSQLCSLLHTWMIARQPTCNYRQKRVPHSSRGSQFEIYAIPPFQRKTTGTSYRSQLLMNAGKGLSGSNITPNHFPHGFPIPSIAVWIRSPRPAETTTSMQENPIDSWALQLKAIMACWIHQETSLMKNCNPMAQAIIMWTGPSQNILEEVQGSYIIQD